MSKFIAGYCFPAIRRLYSVFDSIFMIILILGVAVCPLMLIIFLFWFLGLAIINIQDEITKRRQWNSTPCPHCAYFTNYHELRCAVNPCQVLTKNAVNCRDFEPTVGCRIYGSRFGEQAKPGAAAIAKSNKSLNFF